MRLAAAQDLKTANLSANSPQLLDVGKKEIRALIGRNASRKANGEDFLVEVDVTLCTCATKQFRLRLHVRCPKFVCGNTLGVAQPEIVLPPIRDVPVVEPLKRLTGPGSDVNAIGNRVDLIASEHEPRNFPVFLGNAVDVAAHVEGQVCHVEDRRGFLWLAGGVTLQ